MPGFDLLNVGKRIFKDARATNSEEAKGINEFVRNKSQIISSKPVPRRQRPVMVLPEIRRTRIVNSDPVIDLFLSDLEEDLSKRQYVQGQQECPVCKGVVNYTWSRAEGFLVFECSSNDCLPWPTGGAKQRRENGEPKIVATRYEKK